MFRTITAATIAVAGFVGGAQAATLSGVFDVTVVNVTGVNSSQSQAAVPNLDAALNGTLGNFQGSDTFTYDGDLDFNRGGGGSSTFTIADWLALGTGTVSGLDATVGDLILSGPSIGNGTATTTFFLFDLAIDVTGGDYTITHDDGVAVLIDDIVEGVTLGPTSQVTSTFNGVSGGDLSILYVATNGNPSILEVDTTATPIPVPASLPLLAAGASGLLVLRRRKAKT